MLHSKDAAQSACRVSACRSARRQPRLDLRRHRGRGAVSYAAMVELFIQRADHLAAPDAALVHAVYRDGMCLSKVAALGSANSVVSRESVAQLRRRLRRLKRRCTDPLFAFVVVNAENLPPNMRRVATACVLHGLSVRQAAIRLNLTHHAVRRHRDSLLTIFHTSDAPPAPGSRPPVPIAPAISDDANLEEKLP